MEPAPKRAKQAGDGETTCAAPHDAIFLDGFVDVQVNGYHGVSFNGMRGGEEIGLEDLRGACHAYLREAGVLAFVPVHKNHFPMHTNRLKPTCLCTKLESQNHKIA